MLDIKFNIQLFILLVLCGILIVCFLNMDNFQIKSNTVEQFQNNTDPTTTQSSQQQIIQQASSATIVNNKQKLNALFGAGVNTINGKNIAYLNELKVQTLPKTNSDDIVVSYFYFKDGAPSASSPALDQLIDYVLSERQDREQDFFLRAEDGVQIDILFKYNFKNDFNDIVDVEAVVTEMMPTSRTLTDSEKTRYKALTFDKCEIDYSSNITSSGINEYIKLTLRKTTVINDYIPPPGVEGISAIDGTKEVSQEFIIYLCITDLSSKINATTNTLQLTISDFRPYESYLEYKVGMRVGNARPFTNYLTWQMYIKNASSDKINANEFLSEKLSEKQKELLHDKYNDIITPMFMVDNKIAGLEKSVNLIKDTYNFNKLNNMANNLRFYPVT